MEKLVTSNEEKIESMIYEIRGKQVMLDRDLAELYCCANGTKTVNLAVNRNKDRFPNDFYFQLTEEETNLCSKFQIETLNTKGNHRGTNIKKLPYVFTEEGVAMLATVLRTSVASKISVQIMRTFVKMRRFISTSLLEQKFLHNQVLKNTEDIRILQETFSKFEEKRKVNEIFFEGQIYDAYSKILNIFKTAQQNLIVIDRYADNTILDMISKIDVPVTLIVGEKAKISKLDLEKYYSQYDKLAVIYSNSFHDRYIIIDETVIYHCGVSINHAGKRAFGIDIIGDEEVKNALLNVVKKLK